MNQEFDAGATGRAAPLGGLAGWLLGRLRVGRRRPARLTVLERIALAPRQSLALVEAEGRRFLVATSAEGTPAFYALDAPARRVGATPTAGWPRSEGRARERPAADRDARVSW